MNKSILIVEDDLDIGKSLKQLFTEEGYAVALAANGQLGLDYLQTTPVLPCLILLDIMMPVMDGLQFWQKQQSDSKLSTIPVIVMSADANLETKKAQIRAEAFIKKPLNVVKILDTVERYCE